MVIVCGAFFGMLASSALALPKVPEDNSEVDQYAPTVPDAEGARPLSNGEGGGGGDDGDLPPEIVASLEGAGSDGQAALAFARQAGPTPAGERAGGGGGSANGAGNGVSSDASASSAIAAAITGGGGGLGIVMPIFLGLVAGAGVYLMLRRRSPSSQV